MKKILTLIIVGVLCLSMFSMHAPKARAEAEVIELWRVPVTDNRRIVGADTGDVNGDGIEDLVVLALDANTLQVIKNDGTPLWSPKPIPQYITNVAIGDIDIDGKGEVFILGIESDGWGGILIAFDDDGSQLWQFSTQQEHGYTLIAILNLDGDPQLETFITPGNGQTHYAIDTDGSMLWSFMTDERSGGMIFTDVTGDGVEEIVLASFAKIYVLDKSGALLWKQFTQFGSTGGYIAAGDVIGDGIDDLALSYHGYNNRLYVFRNDGTLLWTKFYGSETFYNVSTPVVIDIDNDGTKEVVVYGGGTISAYKGHDGTLLWSFGNSTFLPYYTMFLHFDIDRDTREEIVFQKDDHVYALSLDGNLALDFTLPNSGTLIQLPHGGHAKGRELPRYGIVADVNADCFDELIIQEIIDGQYHVAAIVLQHYLIVQTEPLGLTAIPGEGLYNIGTDVELTAPAFVPSQEGDGSVRYRFDYWDVDGEIVEGNPIIVHMDANHTATAHYVLQYYLSVGASPEPLNPAPTGEDWYDECTSVELLAPPTAYYMDTKVMSFNYWTVDGAMVEGNPITVHMNAPHTAIAYYYTPAVIDIKPDALNLGSEGEWITAYIELPEGYNVADINISTVMLNGTVPVDPSAPTAIGDYDSDGVPDLMIKFDRNAVIYYILDNIDIEGRFATTTLTITGNLNDGTPFQGSDTIKIILPRWCRLLEFY